VIVVVGQYNTAQSMYKGQHGGGGGEVVVLPFQKWLAVNGGMLSRWSGDGLGCYFRCIGATSRDGMG
jgi:hypothetical protein